MKDIADYLEALSKRERVVQRVGRVMKEGDVWTYPVGLKEGVDYSFKVKGSRNAEIHCALSNGNGALPLREAKGKEFMFSFVPDKAGTYGLTLYRDSAQGSVGPEKVVVTLLKECLPSRCLSGMFR